MQIKDIKSEYLDASPVFQLPLIMICIARSGLAELGNGPSFELGNDPSFELGNDPSFELGNDARRHICDNSSAFKRLYDFCISAFSVRLGLNKMRTSYIN